MDFSAHNPATSNSLSLAARNNNSRRVRRLLKIYNPNSIDNRGWTCLHEAANSDSYESLLLIFKHPDCRPLVKTHEGHTALYLACRNRSSLQTIEALLKMVKDIANYGSTECVTPLHIASIQGRVELIELLINYGAILDVQDFDGDTPLHDAAQESQYEAVSVLLHAGANPDIQNMPHCFTPFHLACAKGCFETVKKLFSFINDINQLSFSGDSPLMMALHGFNNDVISFLLENGADPHIKNWDDEMAIDIALSIGYISAFKNLLSVTDHDKINLNIIFNACKPHFFKFEILDALLNSDLGPEYYEFCELCSIRLGKVGNIRHSYYLTNAPLNSYLNICEYIYKRSPEKFREFFYLFLMRGVSVNALDVTEYPPLVYTHYCVHISCFEEVFQIFAEHGCNVDHCSAIECFDKDLCIPDAFLTSLTSQPSTMTIMLPYSLICDPDSLIQFAHKNKLLSRIPIEVQVKLITMIDGYREEITAETLKLYMPSLKHLCRLKIRRVLRHKEGGVKSTTEYLNILNRLPVPQLIKNYLRYL